MTVRATLDFLLVILMGLMLTMQPAESAEDEDQEIDKPDKIISNLTAPPSERKGQSIAPKAEVVVSATMGMISVRGEVGTTGDPVVLELTDCDELLEALGDGDVAEVWLRRASAKER